MADIATPNVIGSTQSEAEAKLKSAGLVVGTVTTVASATVPKGTVSSAMPAAGTLVGSGSAVNLEVSSGPAPVAVPDVGGLTRAAAVDKLKSAGLKVGAVKTQHSNSVPDGGIASTDPDAGTLVSSGSPVSLEVSNGPEPNWTQFIPTVIFTLLGIVVLWLIVYGITQQGQEFLTSMAKKEVARGLITFLIAIGTVGIAIILAISTLISSGGADADKAFDRGKQVLAVLIGVLGTIVGFYFGSAPDTQKTKTEPAQITTTMLPDGASTNPYPPTTLQSTGLTPPLTWSVTPPLPDELKLDSGTGSISGTPKAPLPKSKFTFTVKDSATPTVSSSADLTLEIKEIKQKTKTEPAQITTTMLPDGASTNPYPSTTLQSTGLTPPLTWSVAPPLPDGLKLDSGTGSISGTPKAPLPKSKFTFTVKDSATPTVSSSADLTLEIKEIK